MKSFFVYEMEYTGAVPERSGIEPIPFRDRHYSQYERIYNECFYEMRKALDIEPYNFYSDIRQLNGKKEGIFLIIDGDAVIGSVGCFGTEIDDLIVAKKYQGRGYGSAALGLILDELRAEGHYDHVEACVKKDDAEAIRLYEKHGFADSGYVDESAPDSINMICSL